MGPFKALDFKIPTRKTEDLYIASVNRSLDSYKSLLVEVGAKKLSLFLNPSDGFVRSGVRY
ncbi:MAG: hypothetical protein WAN18_25555, partial [Candidatus Sulfotelmatobacter sp.]